MLKKLPLLFLFGFLMSSCGGEQPFQAGDQTENNIPESEVASRDTIPNDEVADPQTMPTLNDTTDFTNLRNHLIDLHSYLYENRALRDSIIPNFWKLCPIYFEMYRDRRERDAKTVREAFNELPEVNTENYTFLREILAPIDTTLLAYEKPLGAVFQGITSNPGVYGEERGGKAEKRLLERIREHPNTEVERPDIIQSITTFTFEENVDSVYVFTKTNSTKTSVRNFKFKSLECLSFYHYELGDTGETVDPNDILISTPYNLELEYYWDEELNQMISEEFQGVCLDCPDSSMYQKSFARLKGYENFYFTYTQEPGKETDDTYVPKRSLIYFDGEILHTIWSTDIDLFGCSCL